MMSVILNTILNLLMFVVRYVTSGLNLILEEYLPDLSSWIISTTNTIIAFIYNLSWPLSIVPTGILSTLSFIATIEIARHTIYISTHLLIRMWNLFQKLKFW